MSQLNVRSNRQTFKFFLPSIHHLINLNTSSTRIHAKPSGKENFLPQNLTNRSFRFDHDNWYVNNIGRLLFPTEIGARRELAHLALVSKHQYHPETIEFDVLNNQRWQANIKPKEARFQTRSLSPF